MVTRKPLPPYPASPPPPPPTNATLPESHHDVDSTEVPPIPQLKKRYTEESPYQDMGNPWQNDTASPKASEPDLINSAAATLDSTAQPTLAQIPVGHVPDVLKPGWSAEHTPRSSLDSDRSKDFWESSDDEDGKKGGGKPDVGKKNGKGLTTPSQENLPSILQVKRKPVSPQAKPKQDLGFGEFDTDFASNNPFRNASTQSTGDGLDSWTHVTKPSAKGKEVEVVQDHHQMDTNWGDMLGDRTTTMLPLRPTATTRFDASPCESSTQALPPLPQSNAPAVPKQEPPLPPVSVHPPSPFSEQPPLIAVNADQDDLNVWTSSQPPSGQQSPLPAQQAIYNNDLLDRGAKSANGGGLLSLGDELKALPNHGTTPVSERSSSVLVGPSIETFPESKKTPNEHHMYATSPNTSLPQKQPGALEQGKAQTKPPSAAELAEMAMQRNETYQVKHFRWFDHRTNKLRTSSMLTQNKNGPCPLLALVNALILGAHDQDQAALDEFLRIREQVTLGTIIENLMMELLAAAGDDELPDVDELNSFLLKLRTGMNMNPRFIQPTPPAPNLMDARGSMLLIPDTLPTSNTPGTFEPSSDLRMYSAFGVQTVHGWLPEPASDAASAFRRSAQNYEDAQAKLFGEDELEYRLSGSGLTPAEQVIWEDIVSMKHFLQSSPTQLTQFGIQCIKSSMKPGSFSVLFRNDHFSTIYKHPKDGQIYSLITDAGYADRDEVIWESLVDTSGHNTEFFSGDFQSVSHSGGQPSDLQPSHQEPEPTPHDIGEVLEGTLSPSQRQEQEDADLAMAMQLQEEEEQNDRRRRSQNNPAPPQQPPRPTGRRSTGNIPIPIRGSTGNTRVASQGSGSLVPPRNPRPTVQGVNRASNAIDPDAPPAYEEAARGKAYHPPLGSPLHPASSADGGNNSRSNSSSNVNQISHSSGNRPRGTSNQQRNSAYGDNSNRYHRTGGDGASDAPSPAYDFTDGRMPGSYIHTGRGGHGQSVGLGSTGPYVQGFSPPNHRQRDRDRDCIVM